MHAPPEKKAAPDREEWGALEGLETVEMLAAAEAERKRRVFEALRDYLRNGTSDFEQRRLRARAAALQKGRR